MLSEIVIFMNSCLSLNVFVSEEKRGRYSHEMKAQSIRRMKLNPQQEGSVSTTTTEDTVLVTGEKKITEHPECVLTDTESSKSIASAENSPLNGHGESLGIYLVMTPGSDQGNNKNKVNEKGQDLLHEALEYSFGQSVPDCQDSGIRMNGDGDRVTEPEDDLNLLDNFPCVESFDSQIDNFLFTQFIQQDNVSGESLLKNDMQCTLENASVNVEHVENSVMLFCNSEVNSGTQTDFR